MNRRDQSTEDREEHKSVPMRTIDDAVYGHPPTSRVRRHVVRAKRWFQLDANRWVITSILLSVSFFTIVFVGSFGPVSVQSFLTDGISPGTILVELLKTIVSVVVIVLSINQLVLSPQLGSVGDQQDRYEQTMELRDKVEKQTDRHVSPSSPALFLHVLMAAIITQAEQLQDATAGNSTLHEETSSYAESLLDEATVVAESLADSHFGRFEATSAILRFSISEKVRTLNEIRETHEQTLSPTEVHVFDEMEERLKLFSVAREYLKTIYIRSEYIALSEALLYTGLPSILLTYSAAQLYEPTIFPGQLFGIEHQLLFVSGAVTVSLAPLIVLIAYVFRLAALSRSTLFIGPFAAKPTTKNQLKE